MIKKTTFILLLLSTATFCFGQDYRFGKVSEEEIKETQHPLEPDADAAILYREIKSNFEYTESDGFFQVTEVFERVKIYTKDGLDWANKEIFTYKGENSEEEVRGIKGYTYYMEDGKIDDDRLRNDGIFETSLNKYTNKVSIAMPNVQVGSVIEYSYSIINPFLQNVDPFRFQETIPIKKVDFKFSIPEYFFYKKFQRGWLPLNVKEEQNTSSFIYSYNLTFQESMRDNSKRKSTRRSEKISYNQQNYLLELNDVPSIKEEAYSGNIKDYASALEFELAQTNYPGSSMKVYTSTWENVSKTIYNSVSFGGQLDKSNYFSSDLESVIATTNNDTEKMIAIFEFVKNKMNWNGIAGIYSDEGVRSAFKKQTGNAADINLMLIAMLRESGIQANPILISSRSHGIPMFPTRDGFNFVVAGVEIQDDVILLDATDKNSVPDVLREELLNWQGRLIRNDQSSSWVSLQPKTPADRQTMIAYSISPELLTIKGKVQNRYTGHLAMERREDFSNKDEAERIKIQERRYPEVEIENMEVKNVNDIYKPLPIAYNFESFKTVEEVGNKLYFSPLSFLALEENPFKSEERKYPINFKYPTKGRYIITMSVPENYSVESIPESVRFELGQGAGLFQYIIKKSGNKIQCFVDLNLNQALFLPESYNSIRTFFENIVQKEGEKVVLSKA